MSERKCIHAEVARLRREFEATQPQLIIAPRDSVVRQG